MIYSFKLDLLVLNICSEVIIIKDKFILSTASFCLWDISIQEKLENCKELGFKKVQIAMSTLKMLMEFCENIKHIPQLEYFEEISLHAPWCGFKYGSNKKTSKVLDLLKYIDMNIPIDRYLFNFDSTLDIEVLRNCDLSLIVRNPLVNSSWEAFKNNIDTNNISCAFDLNRALRSEHCLDSMIKDIEPSVSEIHISGFIDDKNRMPVVETNQSQLLNHLDKFNIDKTSLVIEGLFDPKDLLSIDKERKLIMDYCRN